MKKDYETGRIAYHSLRMRADGGMDYVQYDYDGSVEYIREYSPALDLSHITTP